MYVHPPCLNSAKERHGSFGLCGGLLLLIRPKSPCFYIYWGKISFKFTALNKENRLGEIVTISPSLFSRLDSAAGSPFPLTAQKSE